MVDFPFRSERHAQTRAGCARVMTASDRETSEMDDHAQSPTNNVRYHSLARRISILAIVSRCTSSGPARVQTRAPRRASANGQASAKEWAGNGESARDHGTEFQPRQQQQAERKHVPSASRSVRIAAHSAASGVSWHTPAHEARKRGNKRAEMMHGLQRPSKHMVIITRKPQTHAS